MFAAICAMRVPSFRMLGHLFVDAKPASDSALEEQISSTRNITCTRRDALAWLVLSKYYGSDRLMCFHITVHCACDTAFQEWIACTQKIVHMPSDLSNIFFWPQCLRLARLEDPHGLRT